MIFLFSCNENIGYLLLYHVTGEILYIYYLYEFDLRILDICYLYHHAGGILDICYLEHLSEGMLDICYLYTVQKNLIGDNTGTGYLLAEGILCYL